VKRIPPSARAMVIFAAKYIRAFIPGGTFFFSFTLPERRRKLLTEIRGTGIHKAC
jgi:hypothetical protein